MKQKMRVSFPRDPVCVSLGTPDVNTAEDRSKELKAKNSLLLWLFSCESF